MPSGRSSAGAVRPWPNWIGIIGTIAVLHILGWSMVLGVVVPSHLGIGAKAFGIGTALTAYLLGARHAFDADHIAAIDNTIRKLMRMEQCPHSVGFWFSIGHSSVVFGLTLLLGFGVHHMAEPLLDAASTLHDLAGVVGTLFSSGFLYLIAALNLVVLGELWRKLRGARSCPRDATKPDDRDRPGLMSWLLRPAIQLVARPCHMFVVGFLFGLGFDTATEIALLVLASSGAATGLPWYAVLCLPVLFAAGMSLFDTLDSLLMISAYGWARADQARRLWYDVGLTALSAAIGIIVGTIELAALIGAHLRGTAWQRLASIDFAQLGIAVAGLFAVIWVGTILGLQRRRA